MSDATSVQGAKLQFLTDLRVNGSTSQNVARGTVSPNSSALSGESSQAVNAGLSSTLTLFDGFKSTANLRSAQASVQASAQELARAKQTVAFNVASKFVSLITQQEQLRVQQQNLAAQLALEKEIQAYVNAGERPISDLYQQQANAASARRADLGTASTRVDAAKQDVRSAESAKYPTVSLTAGYNTTYNSSLSSGLVDQLGQRQGGSLAIGVSIPIFDKGVAATTSERAQIAEDDAKIALSTAQQSAALDVRRAYPEYQSAQQRLIAAQAQQKAAQMALTATQQRYEVGKATLVEVTQARTTQVQAETALVSARYNLVFQEALMSYYTGELDPAHVSLA